MSAKTDTFAVPRLEPMKVYLYLAPLAPRLEECVIDRVPARPPNSVRVVCISDTHNEHATLVLPEGDVLVHTGDVLTESGLRHVVRDPATRAIVAVKPKGEALFVNFAVWFGSQPFDHKILVAGNHDLVLQGLGQNRVQSLLDEHTTHGRVHYLENREVSIGQLRVFGSPYANYSSHNDAFKCVAPSYDIRPGVHIVATHMPAVLPNKRKGGVRCHEEITQPMLDAGAVLHVGGHCHWANGLYFAEGPGKSIPCVVASVCESHWLSARQLASADGFRGDPSDKQYGGYNLVQPGMICDLLLPKVPALAFALAPTSIDHESVGESVALPAAALPRPRSSPPFRRRKKAETTTKTTPAKPSILFFCPSNDADLVPILMPRFQSLFSVDHAETVAEAISGIARQEYVACVSKLGTKGNTGRDVIAALRSAQGSTAFIAIHSATAARKPSMRAKLDNEFHIDLFTEHGGEDELMNSLEALTKVDRIKPRLLVFAPPNDLEFMKALAPHLPDSFETDVFESASACVQAVREHEYCACFSKLGQEGNLGVDVIAALRGELGPSPFVALHSGTAARKPKLQARLTADLGVNLFAQHGQEADMVASMLCATKQGTVSTETAGGLFSGWLC